MVSMPRRPASSNARSRLPEFPLVDSPTAMSSRLPNAASCRANTTSTPTSLHSAVTTEVSLASPNAGSGGAVPPGLRNSVASWAASVALPPLPKANSRPPAANRAAISRAHSAIRAPSRPATARRSSPISAALATVDARTWSSTVVRSPASAYRNGYSASRSSLMRCRPAGYHGYRFPRVHQDGVAHPGADQGHADGFLTRPGVDDGHLVPEQPHDGDFHRLVRAGDTDVPDAFRQFAHVTTPGPSTPGCSKNTCTSSQSTWYIVTCISLTTRGSAEPATSTWSATLPACWLPSTRGSPTRATVSSPSSLAVSSPATTLGLSLSAAMPIAMSAGLARYLSWCVKISAMPSRSAIPVTVAASAVSEMAGSARLPTMTGWTNSTATCCASVLAPPVPNTTSLPPRWKRTAMAWQAAATASAWPASSLAGPLRSSNIRRASDSFTGRGPSA